MITKYKLFEESKKLPEIGDYVICDEIVTPNTSVDFTELYEFLKRNIGIIVRIKPGEEFPYVVRYENSYEISAYFERKTRTFSLEEIKRWEKNPEDLELEAYIAANKYNL